MRRAAGKHDGFPILNERLPFGRNTEGRVAAARGACEELLVDELVDDILQAVSGKVARDAVDGQFIMPEIVGLAAPGCRAIP